MSSSDDFDEFYVGSRDRLLLECYALTGDILASERAVLDAYVVAWHHWRTVSQGGSPEDWLRPQAHSRATHGHTARPWRRGTVGEPVRRTFTALGRLSGAQRKALILTHLSPLSLDGMARHMGVTRQQAEQHLQAATTTFAMRRGVPSTSVRQRLEELRSVTSETTWPPPTSVRRSGTARRRTHAFLGTVAAGLALVGSGLVVSGGPAQKTSFEREEGTTGAIARIAKRTPPPTLTRSGLLGVDQVERFGPGLRWRTEATDRNLRGNGLVVPCQAERFSDPDGKAALVRRFTAGKQGSATEVVELSSSQGAARRAYRTARSWYAGCTARRTQLVSTHEVDGVGDEAALFLLRTWDDRPGGLAVGVARTGRVTVTTASEIRDGSTDVATAAAGLAAAVNRLCGTPGATTCAAPPRERTTSPLPSGEAPGMLSALDLPPVANAKGPWVGTEPEPARENVAATRCDNTSFAGPDLSRNKTRTFLFPRNEQADAFGLTQSVARTPSDGRARAFVEEVRNRIAECGEADLGTEAQVLVDTQGKDRDLTVWELDIELSDEQVLEFWMAIMRDGSAVSQLGFVPDTGLRMSPEDFRGVSERALDRLASLPDARSKKR